MDNNIKEPAMFQSHKNYNYLHRFIQHHVILVSIDLGLAVL